MSGEQIGICVIVGLCICIMFFPILVLLHDRRARQKWQSERASETRAFPLRGGGEIWFTKKTTPIGRGAMHNQPLAFLRYRRRPTFTEMISWHPSFDMSNVSVSAPDKADGSPKLGDMIARNPQNRSDKWLVAKDYFEKNFEPEPLGPGE